MKYISVFSFIVAIVIIIMGGISCNTVKEASTNDYLRIHIRANSNEVEDQRIKYEVKNAVVEAVTPLLCDCNTKSDVIQAISNNKAYIERISDEILTQKGFSYSTNIKLTQEYFPTRSYNDVVLNSGIYDAMIVELGSATGNNWWCVVYPPLCFTKSENMNVVYKSKLLEMIRKFFNK